MVRTRIYLFHWCMLQGEEWAIIVFIGTPSCLQTSGVICVLYWSLFRLHMYHALLHYFVFLDCITCIFSSHEWPYFLIGINC